MGELVALNGKVHEEVYPQYRLVRCQDPGTLSKNWEYVKAGLEKIKKKARGQRQWTPRHVRQRLLAGLLGQSTFELFFAADEKGALKGFVVVYTEFDEFVNLPTGLHVWLGFTNLDVIRALLPQFEAIARERDLDEITFTSPRRGWMKKQDAILTLGFRVKEITYGKAL